MKTIKINLYKFEELSKEAKQIALEKFSDINVNYDWWEFTYDDAENVGLKLKNFDLDRNKHATGEFITNAKDCADKILKEHGESCDTHATATNFLNTLKEIEVKYEGKEETSEEETEIEDLEYGFLKDILEDYATILQNECEYLQTEKSIIETIEANDYDFTIDGKLY